MMNGSDQSETTSLTQSWPTTPKRSVPIYYVQSPSRESHEEEDKSSNQGRSLDSPLGSRSSSSSRVSGKVPGRNRGGLHEREWRVIQEEEDEEGEEPIRRSHVCAVGLAAIVGVFFLFCLVMWGATSTRPFAPHISLKKLTVNDFYTGQGLDMRGVPTKMLTVNCWLQMRVHNPATFFGIHISSTSFNLLYYDLTLASGQIEEYYQARKSWRDVSVEIKGNKVPLYGASTGFEAGYGSREVPLRLELELKTRGDVVGKLLRSKHLLQVSCYFTINPNNPKSVGFVEDSCTYH
ncbi:hypothetical protein V2J09_018827 [Rumex salicifolius]